MIEYTITAQNQTRLLLAGPDHWLIVDLIPDTPIRMTRADSQAEAYTIFEGA